MCFDTLLTAVDPHLLKGGRNLIFGFWSKVFIN